MSTPYLSVVIPVYNEETGLRHLFDRLYPALDALGKTFEVLFVDDGSQDRSVAILRGQFEKRPDVTRIIILNSNCGQHLAIMAGFERCRGQVVVTLDADLQNPPEEIGKLLEKFEEGYDYVSSIRRMRQDSLFRRTASRLLNAIRERTTRIRMTDQGCMLRAYSRAIIDAINGCREVSLYIPALAYTFAQRPTEIEVEHEARAAGQSKYSLYRLIRLNFDLMTGFSTTPLQLFSMFGILVSVVSFAVYVAVIFNRLILAEGIKETSAAFWDRDILEFFLIGIILFGLGLIGEYVGRIHQHVQARPRFVVAAVIEREDTRAAGTEAARAP
jgi:undecaprenyl-phosphate 4-deoxy-4-formamido-L-arabinose transferase